MLEQYLNVWSIEFFRRMTYQLFCLNRYDMSFTVMTRASEAKTRLPPQSLRALLVLGRDVATARRSRRIPQRIMAERMLVSIQTLQRLEAGDPTVGVSVLASALFVLGLTGRLERLVAHETDSVALTEQLRRLPRSAHAPPADDLDF